MHFFHKKLFSVALEILEDIPEPDVVVVCCGGGGFLSGVAAGIKLKGKKKTRIFGVEPEGGECFVMIKYILIVVYFNIFVAYKLKQALIREQVLSNFLLKIIFAIFDLYGNGGGTVKRKEGGRDGALEIHLPFPITLPHHPF